MASHWAPDRLDRERYPGPGLDLPVLFGDLDTNMHVNNVMMGRFFEESRVDSHFNARVPHILRELGLHNLIARVATDYVNEGRYRRPLHVRLRVASIDTTSATYEQAAWQGDHCVALAEVIAVCRSADGAAKWPDEARGAGIPQDPIGLCDVDIRSQGWPASKRLPMQAVRPSAFKFNEIVKTCNK